MRRALDSVVERLRPGTSSSSDRGYGIKVWTVARPCRRARSPPLRSGPCNQVRLSPRGRGPSGASSRHEELQRCRSSRHRQVVNPRLERPLGDRAGIEAIRGSRSRSRRSAETRSRLRERRPGQRRDRAKTPIEEGARHNGGRAPPLVRCNADPEGRWNNLGT